MSPPKKQPQLEDLYPGVDASKPLTVSELASLIDEAVKEGVGYVWVEGEVRDFKTYPSGHSYCSLSDGKATVNVAFFSRIELPPDVGDGAHVLIFGRPEFYGPYARLSLVAEEVHLFGEGELWAKIEQTRKKLDAEGLFDDSRKRPLPLLPSAVGVVCGHDAAVKRDILAATDKRFPGYPLVFEEVTIQGDRAVKEIIAAMERLARDRRVDVIILARGGGSLADLAPFFDEDLCRAIARCPVPVVSAIGHEKDNPLSDLVADLRASTPSRAAMEVIPDETALRDRLGQALDAMTSAIERRLEAKLSKLEVLDPGRILKDVYLPRRELILSGFETRLVEFGPKVRLERERSRLEAANVTALMKNRIYREESALEALSRSLDALSPRSTLERGYAVVRTSTGDLVRSARQAPAGTELTVTLAEGILDAVSKGESGPDKPI